MKIKERGKGENEVATLVMKYLSDKGYLDDTTQFDLSIIMDDCFSQNKNNYVLRLPAYLTMNNYFEKVQIVLLVTGHTKNTADRLFNLLKLDYRKEIIISLSELIKVYNQTEYVTCHKVDWKVIDNKINTVIFILTNLKQSKNIKSSKQEMNLLV